MTCHKRAKTYWMNWQRAERIVRSTSILMSVSSKNLITLSGQKVSQCQLSIVQPDWLVVVNLDVAVAEIVLPSWEDLSTTCDERCAVCTGLKVVYKYFIAFNTHLPIKIFSPYFVDLLVLMGVALSTIFLISSGETSSNRDIFFTDDAAKNFFPTSKISAQEIRHHFFLVWSNLTIMAHIMGLGNQSKSWKIIILS